jgi:CDP-diacylglycerol--glycerol-3-phosphate 3-phosphatidyltransferase
MFAEDLLVALRRDGFSAPAIVRYVREIATRVVRRLPHHAELARSVAATAIVLFALQFCASLLLAWAYERRLGVAYLVSSSAILLAASFWLLFHIGLAHPVQGGREMRRIPFPVALTLARLVSIPAIVLLIHERRWHAAVWVYAASASTDVIDGVMARAWRLESRMGSVLDPITDIAFNSSVFVALTEVRELPAWVTGLMLARYALLVFGTIYLYLFVGPVRIQPTAFGKLTGVVTTLLVGLLLLGLAAWNNVLRHQLRDVFDVGIGLLALATIIQVLFIGIANKKALEQPLAEAELPGKVVGDVRWPRR